MLLLSRQARWHRISWGRAKKADDYTLVLHLAYPSEDLHRQAASTAWLPCYQPAFEESSGRYGRDKDTLVDNGPFRMMLWEHGKTLRLKQNLNYKGHLAPTPSGVLFTIGVKPEEMPTALLNGEVDAATVPRNLIRKFKDTDYHVTEFRIRFGPSASMRRTKFSARKICV